MAKTIQQRIGKAHRKLDKQIQQSVTGNCIICGKKAQVFHHYIYKSQSSFLRYEPKNLIPMCTGCHFTLHNKDSSLATQIAYRKGKEWEDWIQANRRNFVKKDKFYLEHLQELLLEFDN